MRLWVPRCCRGFSPGWVIALRSVVKSSCKGPAFASSIAVNIVESDNQTTIAWSRRFTNNWFASPGCNACMAEVLNESLVASRDTKSRRIFQILRLFIGDVAVLVSIDHDVINRA